jgi:CRISP-associated protein Cas1
MAVRELCCPQCGRDFTTRRLQQTFCSRECNCAAMRARLAVMEGEARLAGKSGPGTRALRKERAAAVDGRPVLVSATGKQPEHVRFKLDGAAWREGAERWQWRVHTDWNVLALGGHGVRLSVNKDRLRITEGRTSTSGTPAGRALYRGTHGVQCIVLLASSGSVTLDALQWCRDQNITVLVLDRNGQLAAVMTPPWPANVLLRRMQYTADPLPIAKCVVAWKLRESSLARPAIVEEMQTHKQLVDGAETLDALRMVEATAARVYWTSWDMGVWWADREVPPHWRTFDRRESHLSPSGRHATHPVNAMLNYAYAVLAGMIERAIISRGLDPTMGHLHAPKDGRASLVYDLIEPLRPMVDAQLLAWVQDEQWRMGDFTVDRTGIVRLHPELARVVVQKCALPDETIGAVLDWYVGRLRALIHRGPGPQDPWRRGRARGVGLGVRRQPVLIGTR